MGEGGSTAFGLVLPYAGWSLEPHPAQGSEYNLLLSAQANSNVSS